MKSVTIYVFELAKRRSLAVLIGVILPIISPLAFADGGTWSLDPATSSARLFQGSTANPDSVNTGVARVTGDVRLDTNDLNNSVFDLSIYPADENWGHALSPEDSFPTGDVPHATDRTLMTFKSNQILRTGNGKLKVIGELTLTRVERSVLADANEAYAAPVYDDPIIHTETREVTFLFPNLSAALSAGPLRPVNLTENRDLDLSGSAYIGYETFPGLLSSIQDTNWPIVIQNERCQTPSTVGEDYHGAMCTGMVIATTHNDNCQVSASGGEEDYTGPVCTPPAGGQTTIALTLKMVRTSADAAAAILPGITATR